jgi:hypothetical protein
VTKLTVSFRNFANVPNKRRVLIPSSGFEPAVAELRLRPHGLRDRRTNIIPFITCKTEGTR